MRLRRRIVAVVVLAVLPTAIAIDWLEEPVMEIYTNVMGQDVPVSTFEVGMPVADAECDPVSPPDGETDRATNDDIPMTFAASDSARLLWDLVDPFAADILKPEETSARACPLEGGMAPIAGGPRSPARSAGSPVKNNGVVVATAPIQASSASGSGSGGSGRGGGAAQSANDPANDPDAGADGNNPVAADPDSQGGSGSDPASGAGSAPTRTVVSEPGLPASQPNPGIAPPQNGSPNDGNPAGTPSLTAQPPSGGSGQTLLTLPNTPIASPVASAIPIGGALPGYPDLPSAAAGPMTGPDPMAPVPLPFSVVLLGAGLAGLFGIRWRARYRHLKSQNRIG